MATILLYLYPLIFMRAGFLAGDSLVQFYPWSEVYSEAIKRFSFPFWCEYFHSGFPLMAEGQVGGFYPLNILMYFLLPFKIAYNYSIILHFMIAGIFTYLFSRRIGADQAGGFLSALLFCFGSAYAGCFYNIITLRTLAVFPLVLFLVENYSDSKRIRYIVLAGIFTGMQFLAGFLQLAAYSFGFYIIYMLCNFRLSRLGIKKSVLSLLIFIPIVLLIALPQIMLTYPLAQGSGRAAASLGFALWRSFSPAYFIGALFPYLLGSLSAQFYISIFGILFMIYAILQFKDIPKIMPIILIGAISILCALGKYNPLYVGLLKISGFYGLRNPSKFLFFGLFAASVLSGVGFSKFFNQPKAQKIRLCLKIFIAISAFALGVFFILKTILYYFKDYLIAFAREYAHRSIVGKPYHRYDLTAYMGKVESLFNGLIRRSDLADIFTAASVVLIFIAVLVCLFLIRYPKKLKIFRIPILCLIFIDIYVYSFHGIGFRGNIKNFDCIKPAHAKILEIVKADKAIFRILPFGLKDKDMPDWVKPNTNILYKIDSVAAYTPLAEKEYRDALLGLEIIDDSLGLLSPEDKELSEKYEILRLLNVKYIISARDLNYSFLQKIGSENGTYLYRLKNDMPRAFFSYSIDENIEPVRCRDFEVLEYGNGFLKVEIDTVRDGFLIFSENYYPGWIVSVDGIESQPLKVKNIVQAVRLRRGARVVVFKYKPFYFER
ncbi:MAG: hypothetical protein RAP41_07125 [Candidatus Orphnella occulta]|nr:hypothetical protein [Candidatus Orphnella occulta]